MKWKNVIVGQGFTDPLSLPMEKKEIDHDDCEAVRRQIRSSCIIARRKSRFIVFDDRMDDRKKCSSILEHTYD